jgi:hypothetical protein
VAEKPDPPAGVLRLRAAGSGDALDEWAGHLSLSRPPAHRW